MSTTGIFLQTVAYLDDNPDDLLLFQQAVARTKTPFVVHPFLSPEEFLRRLSAASDNNEFRPDLFICDYDLGSVRAYDIVPLVRAHSSALMVILSGTADPAARALCYSSGANYFLRKPLSVDRFDALVKGLYQLVCGISLTLTTLPEYSPPPPNTGESRAA